MSAGNCQYTPLCKCIRCKPELYQQETKITMEATGTPTVTKIPKEQAIGIAYDTLRIKYDLTISEFWKLKDDYKKLKDVMREIFKVERRFQERHGSYSVEKRVTDV